MKANLYRILGTAVVVSTLPVVTAVTASAATLGRFGRFGH